MDEEALDSLRSLFRSYKRSASRLRDCAKLVAKSGKLQFSMSWSQTEGLQASFDEEAPLIRFAALLRPFMAHESQLELTAVWTLLLSNGLVDGSTRETIDQHFASAEHLGMALVLNNRQLTARDIYDAYAEGFFFNENPEAKRLLEQLAVGPMSQMVAYLFHGACMSYARVVFALLEVILQVERSTPQLEIPRSANPRCIYCLQREGDFGPEEHVIPEAFGLDELVLRDCVCQECNNKLSKLDQFLAEFEALGLLRVMYVGLTKKGKLPRAEYRDFVIEKVKPRELKLTGKTNQEFLTTQDLGAGAVQFSMKAVGRTRTDVSRLGRSLFKIGLGLVAHDHSVDYACDSRFDAAREFIFGRGPMPNHLWVPQRAIPNPAIRTWWQSIDGGTVVALDFFGVVFIFNLEPTDFSLPDGAPSEAFTAFWLGTPRR